METVHFMKLFTQDESLVTTEIVLWLTEIFEIPVIHSSKRSKNYEKRDLNAEALPVDLNLTNSTASRVESISVRIG